MATKCKFCNSLSFGSGCFKSRHKHHGHSGVDKNIAYFATQCPSDEAVFLVRPKSIIMVAVQVSAYTAAWLRWAVGVLVARIRIMNAE